MGPTCPCVYKGFKLDIGHAQLIRPVVHREQVRAVKELDVRVGNVEAVED